MVSRSWAPPWLVLLAFVVTTIAWGAPVRAAPAAGAFTRGAVPRWVVAAEVDRRAKTSGDATLVDLVVDDQLRITRTLEHYIRRSRQVVTVAGVEHAGEIEVEIDPSYERFVLHGIHVVRGEQHIDAAKTADIRVLDAEDSRDKRLYNGTRSIVFVLSDVRVGDVVEWEGTVIGQNPVYGGRFARRFFLGSSRPTIYRRVRILSPKDRPLRALAKGHPAKTLETGNENELLWEGESPPDLADEGEAPDWFDPTPTLSVSEYASWAEVARWAAPLYDATAPPGPALSSKIAEIAAAHDTPEKRALAALRFVQDDVRYLGIELGESSHRPHSASKVLEQRFGDCKDKVMLLVTMLRGLGIEAHAVLVNTDLDERIRDALPGPNAFDHVIARLRIDGRDHWVDPTRNLERGPLGSTPVHHGLGLVAASDSADLAPISTPAPADPAKEIEESFHVDANNDARLEVVSIYRRLSADALRADLDAGRRGELDKHYLEFYERQYPNAKRRSPMVIEDDPATGVLVIRESYDLPGAFERSRLPTWAETMAAAVTKPRTLRRETPLAVHHPSFTRHTVVVDGVSLEPPADVTTEDDILRYTLRSERRPKGVKIVHELKTFRDHVEPPAVAKHLEVRTTIREALEQDLEPAKAEPDAKKKSENGLVGIGIVVVFCVMVVAVLVYAVVYIVRGTARSARRVGRRWWWLRRVEPDRGHVASKPRRATDRDDAERTLRREACECGKRDEGGAATIGWSTVALGDARITSARVECPSCGVARVRYFDVAKAE